MEQFDKGTITTLVCSSYSCILEVSGWDPWTEQAYSSGMAGFDILRGEMVCYFVS